MDRRIQQRTLLAKAVLRRGTPIHFSEHDLEQTLPARFAQVVQRCADRPTVIDPTESITYTQSYRVAHQIASAIQHHSPAVDRPIAMLVEHGVWYCTAMHAILQTGNIVVPLQHTDPPAYLQQILRDLGNPLLLTTRSHLPLALSLADSGPHPLLLEEAAETGSPESQWVSLPDSCGPDSLAFILFTSGSTGRPKGVMSTHRQVLRRLQARIKWMGLCYEDCFTGFGAGLITPLFTSLAGVSCFEFDLPQTGFLAAAQYLAEHQVTVLRATVSSFRQLVRTAGDSIKLPSIRLVIFASEPPTPNDIVSAQKMLPPHCVFCNQYGAIEAGTVTIFYADQESVVSLNALPPGYPVMGKEILLLDDDMKTVPPGKVGEIAVRGPSITSGYWQQPQLTAERYHPDPIDSANSIYLTGDMGYKDGDGCLHYAGRNDFRVKIRGHSIEILAIEDALRTLPLIADAAVVVRPGPNDEPRLIGYVVPAVEDLTVTAIRQALGSQLPPAMIPTSFMFLDKLPMTASLKLNRRALPDPGSACPKLATPFEPPTTPLEKQVALVWAEVLKLDKVGIHDNFLELGGDSLLAGQIISQIIQRLHVNVSINLLFDSPTIADMALAVTQSRATVLPTSEIQRLLAEVEARTPSIPE